MHLDDAEIHNFVSNFPAWTYDTLTKADLSRHKHSILGAVISTVLGTIIGGVVGFLVGGPYGAVAGAVHGAAVGMNLGSKALLEMSPISMALFISLPRETQKQCTLTSIFYLPVDHTMLTTIQVGAFTPIISTSPGSQKFRMWLPSNNVYQLRTQNLNAAIRYHQGPD